MSFRSGPHLMLLHHSPWAPESGITAHSGVNVSPCHPHLELLFWAFHLYLVEALEQPATGLGADSCQDHVSKGQNYSKFLVINYFLFEGLFVPIIWSLSWQKPGLRVKPSGRLRLEREGCLPHSSQRSLGFPGSPLSPVVLL